MSSPTKILIIEDSLADAKMLRMFLESLKTAKQITIVKHGLQAMAYLRRESEFQNEEKPDLIILDLNLPGKDGREILGEIKSDEHLKTIPVVILSTSNDPDDIREAYRNHANCYITKPVDHKGFETVAQTIEELFFKAARLAQ